MFGYVIVNKPELKIKDFDIYHSFYCGLCQSLHETYGSLGRMTLNYDMTFLTLLLSGLYDHEMQQKTHRCILHPIHKKKILYNEFFDYAADMTILLSYLKCEDDWKDDHSYSKKAMQRVLQGHYERVQEKYPNKTAAIVEVLEDIHLLEEQNHLDLDQMSTLFGKAMAEIYSYKEDEWKDTLSKMGLYMGKFIYIMDAYDDVEEDRKHHTYNPFALDADKDDFEERSRQILEVMMAECCRYFEQLPVIEYADILRNILYSGIWTKYEMVRKKRLGDTNESI